MALTVYSVDGRAMAVMIHPDIWNKMIDRGIVDLLDAERPFRS